MGLETQASASNLLRMLVLVATFSTLVRGHLRGIRHRNETSTADLNMVSMSGGLQFYIDGDGFDDQAHINTVMFEPTQADEEQLLRGPALSTDDEIQSATSLGRLAYTVPAITDLFGSLPIEAFSTHYLANDSENIEFVISVENTADAKTSSCDKSTQFENCHMKYSMRYTPLLHDISPSNVYHDQQLTILINPQAANDEDTIPSTYDPVVHIKLGGTRTDSEGLIDFETRLSNYKVGTLKTKAGDQLPGNHVPEVRFRVGNAFLRESAKHCNFAGDDCWYVKTHPKIDSISAVDGYKTGGQTITIAGWGLKGATLDDVSVTIDGVACKVTLSTQEEVTCVTGAAEIISNDGVSQPGSPGLTQQIMNSDDDNADPYWTMRTDGAVPIVETKLLTAFENSYSNYTRAGTTSKGWFKAPAAGNYRFFMSCNDACKLLLDQTNKFVKDAPVEPTRQEIAIRYNASGWRNYLLTPEEGHYNQYQSAWIAMEEGEYYSIEGFMMEYTGNDHFTVSVEYEQADTTGHHHASKEVQILSIDPANASEKFTITVSGANGSKFQVMFVNPNYDPKNKRSQQIYKTRELSDNDSARIVNARLSAYYRRVWGCTTSISQVKYDANDIKTDDSSLAVKTVFTIEVLKQIYGPSFTMASIITKGSSTITIEAPFQESTPPMSGYFYISCPNDDGNEFRTRDFSYGTNLQSLDFYTMLQIPHLQFKTYFRETNKYGYIENGREFMIIFQDYHGDVPLCTIKSSDTTPIEGNEVVFNASTLREYGQNLMFEPIPLEFLYSDAQQPQVLITVNGIDGVCPDFNCDYIYIDTESEIQVQTLTNGVELTITGVGLPTEDIQVKFANAECEGEITASETEITCSLNFLPAAGPWCVEVIDYRGLIPIDKDVEPIYIDLVIDGISPNSDLNQLGGDELTFTGTGFDSRDISASMVVFSDATVCNVTGATPTTLTCIIDGFDADTLDTDSTYTTTITINGVENADYSVVILSTKQSGQTVSPNWVSPVLASVLTVTLESTYPETLTSIDQFSATLMSADDPTISRKLYVMSVNDADKTLQIKFPGAESGNYNIMLVGGIVGRIDKTPLELTVGSQVTGISPLSGSVLGGTLVTIDGVNFSDDLYDNPVKVGDNWCLVQTTSVTQITCRVMETYTDVIKHAVVITFLRTSEEAENLVDNTFEFSEPVAAITDMTNAFDAVTNKQIITLEGTGLGTDTTAIEFYVDGVAQTVLTATDTTATIMISEMLDETSSDVQIYFTDGLPTGYADFLSVTVVPTFVSISPATGSSGGTLITVTGTGFGTSTEGVNLTHEISGTDICEEVNMTGYGTFTCLTTAMQIVTGDSITLKTTSGSYSCGNTKTPDECNFEQLDSSSPVVTAATLDSSSTITVTGTAFPTSDYDVIVLFKGVESSSAVIDSDTSITATFSNGIPVSDTANSPSVRFVPTETRIRRRLMSLVDADLQLIAIASDVTISNTLSVTDSTNGLSCSFQGGCSYSVSAVGLTASLIDSATNSIDVCGNPCVINAEESDADQLTCTLPYVSTAYSASNFEIVTQGILHDGTWTSTASDAELAKVIDGKNMIDMIDSTSQDCFIQIQYKENHVGVLDEVKFFINRLVDKSPFEGNLVFQGSDDGTTFTDLWAIDKSVHEGWNSLDFEEDQPSYNIYRFQGAIAGSCRIGEVKLHGVESIDNDDTSYSCTPKLIIDDSVTELNLVTFDAAITPVLTGMSARFGSVLGNEQVKFYGTGFSASAATTVTIDNRECDIDSKTENTITCTTSDKPYRPDTPELKINIEGFGLVATKGQVFLYTSRWSDAQTWGYDLAPQDGEAVNIPKGLHLLFDIDVGPKLSFVNVEGSLIFPPDSDPNHQRTFDAHYILVQHGYMEVGTEENRYTSKLTITMHSTKYSPNLPIFGNKVIGVHYGVLEMHGNERPIPWTDLKETAAIGATSITLNDVSGDALDWQVGEDIVIASTNFSGRDAEQRTIESITNTDTNPVITFSEPLTFKHYAGIQYFGDDFIEMRAEVGLLTRNVKYQGDETSPDEQYGAVIIMHSPGDETTAARIDGIELTNVGQAFILGSYPIHFHMIGTVHSSYVRNNAIHHTFNRAVTIHGVHYLRVQNNVAYHTMGHTIFIEDAAETKNLIEGNLIVDVRRSWSLLNTDMTPAAFWITNPNNIIRNNHAAGSDRYSYWYDLQKTAIGPSFDVNICPEHVKLGEFRDNVAHSNGRYGLRLFHSMIPREHPCSPIDYETNKPIIANFYNLVAYKNGRNGAISENTGAVQWHNFKTADNRETGMEMSETDWVKDGYAKIVGGLVIGKSENTEKILDRASPKGIVCARTENFAIEGVSFYNFNFNNAAALGTCSHCWHDKNTDSGGRTIMISDLYFDEETVHRRVSYSTPWRTIFHDATGSMTGLGPNSWFVPYWEHLLQPECEYKGDWGGIICDSSVEVRRIAVHGLPDQFFGMNMKITPFDRSNESQMKLDGILEEYLESQANYSVVPFKSNQDPGAAWAMPFVTNHRYRIHWESGLDMDTMLLTMSERWQETDKDIFLNFNFTESREAVNITENYGGGEQKMDKTLIEKKSSDLVSGDNWVRNETDIRTFELVINGKNESNKKLRVQPLECIHGPCVLEDIIISEEFEMEEGQRLWSNPDSWAEREGGMPVEGDEVEIMSGWNMLLDLNETPYLKTLNINGRLSFIQKEDFDIHLKSETIFVRAGEFFIGSVEEPFTSQATITLMGEQEAETLTLAGTVKGGNKILAVNGLAAFYGKPRDRMTRLLITAYKGQDTIVVEAGLDWAEGDEIFLAATASQHNHNEYRKIVSYAGGEILLDQPLNFYHWGDAESTKETYGVDMRGEVLLLSRNIKIQGEDRDGWGGQVMATDMFEQDGTWRKGSLMFDYVQVYNCSQKDTYKSAIRFEGAAGGHSRISNSVTHNGLDWGISVRMSNNIELINNAFVGYRAVGMNLDKIRNCTITGNFIGDVVSRSLNFMGSILDKEACVAHSSYFGNSPSYDITFTDNIAAGCISAGFIAPGHKCGDKNQVSFRNNVAHSVDDSTKGGYGAHIYANKADKTSNCWEFSHFTAYKCKSVCVVTFADTKEQRAHDLTCIDNRLGISLNIGGKKNRDEAEITLSDSHIWGETKSEDCPQGHDCYCEPKQGFMSAQFTAKRDILMNKSKSASPVYNSHSEGVWGGIVKVHDTTFSGFRGKTRCGERNVMFGSNPNSPDKIAPHFFDNCKLENVDDNGFAFLAKPKLSWANIKDCGNFPCTAPNNWVIGFTNTKYDGVTPSSTAKDFAVVPDDKTVGGTYPNCVHRPEQQAYICQTRNVGLLQIDNLDADSWDRAVQPIFVLNEATGFNNTINAMMDHIWDTFYTGQRRMGRFPIQLLTGEDYTIHFSGTPPKKMRINLAATTGGTKIRIPYPVAGSITVIANGKKQDYTPWDEKLGRNAPLTKTKGCGESRFVGIDNFLEFYITPGCNIELIPRDTIMTKVRMEWTLAEFYSDGGTTRFVDRLAASLGIDSYRIKTVAVYEGSVVVDFTIEADEGESADQATATLAAIKTQLVAQVDSGELNIGAPIMGLQGDDGEVLSGDPIPAAPGQATAGGNFFAGEGNSAIVGDSNLWDGLIVDPETVYVQEPSTEPSTEPTVDPLDTVNVENTISIGAWQEPVEEHTPTWSPTPTTTPAVIEEEPVTVDIKEEEKPRDTVFETKIVEIVEYDNVNPVAAPEKEEDDGNRVMMTIIVASIIGVLLLVIVAMVVRVLLNQRKMALLPFENVNDVQTGVVEVEPQFVLAADDSKNIFGRPSTAHLNEQIEGSDNKKPGTAGSGEGKKRRAKKIVIRKRKTSAQGNQIVHDQGSDSMDDGFRNYDGTSAPRVESPEDSATKGFNETKRSSAFDGVCENSTRKLKNIPLHRIE